MFVFALVKQSPKQSASRDPRWDRSKKKKKSVCACMCASCFLAAATFTLSRFCALVVSLPAGDDPSPTLIVLAKSVAVYKVRGLLLA